MKYLVTLMLLIAVGLSACYQEESIKYNSSGKLFFEEKKVSNGVIFNWKESTISSFNEYVVTKHEQATAAITNLADLNKLNSSKIVARIKNRKITTIKDSTTITNAYYRLYLVYGNQFLASEEISLSSNFCSLEITNFIQFLVDHKKGNLYLFQASNIIEIIDLKNLKQVAFYNQPSVVSVAPMSIGYDKNGNTVIYSAISDKLFVLDGENFKIIDTLTKTKGKIIYSTATDENSNVFFIQSDTLLKYDPVTMKMSNIVYIGANHDFLKVSKDGGTIFTGTVFSNIYQYSINKENSIVSFNRSVVPIDFIKFNSTLSNTDQTIICGARGSIYTKDFQFQKNLSNEMLGYIKSIFDRDDEFIYSVSNLNQSLFKFENKAGYKLIAKIPIRSNVVDIFEYNGSVFVIGSLFDPRTGINKLSLERVKSR